MEIFFHRSKFVSNQNVPAQEPFLFIGRVCFTTWLNDVTSVQGFESLSPFPLFLFSSAAGTFGPYEHHWRDLSCIFTKSNLSLKPLFHRDWRLPGHSLESRFALSGHGPANCLSCSDVFCPPPNMCPMSVLPIRRVLLRQNHPMRDVQLVWNSSSDVCTNEVSVTVYLPIKASSTYGVATTQSGFPSAMNLLPSDDADVVLTSHKRWKDLCRNPPKNICSQLK